MKGKKTGYGIAMAVAIICIFMMTALAQQAGNTAGKKAFTFHGKVEMVDAKAKTLTVNGEKVAGWMDSMSMTYALDKEDVFKKIKVGDQITAKVYEGDYKVLHDVQIVPRPSPLRSDFRAPADGGEIKLPV